MRSSRTLRRVAFAAILSAGFLFQGTWALAATSGGIAGVVHDDTGAPVAAATVTATSPSQVATTTTDAQGHFVFLVLQPDTYTLTVSKDGYQTTSVAGNTVFADQTQQVVLTAPRAVAVIYHAHVSAAGLVKPGVGGDIYNVTPAGVQAASALGGGGNLESAYSAIASVPGLVVGTGGMGWNQAVIVHGELPWTTGFEYDGVPVNRAFDQYDQSTESSLGLQELQVYTGGGPSSIASSGISGFINTVIKTGTYPGYATLAGGIGAEAFYHEAKFEAGGATPDRNFSYYVGISGYDSAIRVIDQSNGASYLQPGGSLAGYAPLIGPDFNTATGQAVDALCDNSSGFFSGTSVPAASHEFGCFAFDSGFFGSGSYISDRENIVNLHMGIPRRDGQRDDIQALWSDSAMRTYIYDSASDTGPGVPQTVFDNTGNVLSSVNYPAYADSTTYNLPFGTQVNPGTGVLGTPYQYYYQPNSPTDRGFMSQIPSGQEGDFLNDVGIVKLQWTHPFSDNAYMRVYGYTMFSDWNQADPMTAYEYDFGPTTGGVSPDYDLITHTSGGNLTFADQFNDQNLVNLSINYTTATTSRWNNTGFIPVTYADSYTATVASCPGGAGNFRAPGYGPNPSCSNAASSPIGLISYTGGVFTCWSTSTMTATPCSGSAYKSNAYTNATFGEPAITGAALAAGAEYSTLWNGNASASWNTVQPQFYNVSLSDEFRPNDKWLFDVAGRYDNYNYVLANTNNIQNDFYTQIIQDYLCLNPSTDTPYLTPLTAGTFPPPAPDFVSGACPTGYVHPNGVGGNPLFTDTSPHNYDMFYWEGRVAATYTQDPNTVWRFSAGRYSEPPLTAAVQYFNSSGNNLNQWANFTEFGFLSPFHPIPGETSAQYNLSLEHHFANSQWSMKITPYYDQASNWEQQFFIGANYVTQIPVGEYKDYGVEFALQDGDFAQNGLSGELTFTYTNAKVQFQSLLGSSIVQQINTAIGAYNCLTHTYYSANTSYCNSHYPNVANAGGAAPCFQGGYASDCTWSGGAPYYPCQNVYGSCNVITNAYYNSAPQSYLSTTAWVPASALGLGDFVGPGGGGFANSFASPYVSSLILNFRHDKWAITPSIQFEAGANYGSPYDFDGIDPLACSLNGLNQGPSGTDVYTSNNYHNCDYATLAGLGGGASPYGYLYVPNPTTGHFANLGEYTEPNIVIGNIQASYDVSPRLRITVTAADLWHTCFGGSQESWTVANPPSSVICGYTANGYYNGGANGEGWYVGTSPNDVAANGVKPLAFEEEPYVPLNGNLIGSYLPLEIYIQAQLHL